jgi:hypothetical protein
LDFFISDLLEKISNLPMLNQIEQNIIYADIINLRAGFSFLQEKTNKLLLELVGKIEELKISDSD